MHVTAAASCARCGRDLSAEKPVCLPDTRSYCMACCESMAGDDFEMETGESFTKWIEKHPQLVMQYQPLELSVRKMSFLFPLFVSVLGLGVLLYGVHRVKMLEQPLIVGLALPLVIVLYGGLLAFAAPRIRWRREACDIAAILLLSLASLALPIFGFLLLFYIGKALGFIVLGLAMILFFGALALRGAKAWLRAQNFKLTLAEGVFHLQHGSRAETFPVDDVTQACVVRPGTVGATEGALRLKDGRMLTLDTCLSDLHALGVVMDLRFREEFPPSADDLARARREKLRKIRGLA